MSKLLGFQLLFLVLENRTRGVFWRRTRIEYRFGVKICSLYSISYLNACAFPFETEFFRIRRKKIMESVEEKLRSYTIFLLYVCLIGLIQGLYT